MSCHLFDNKYIIILGKTPLLASQIEENLCNKMPEIKDHIVSFEDYIELYDFSKNKGGISLLLVEEADHGGKIGEYLSSLSAIDKSERCRCVLLTNKAHFESRREADLNPKIIANLSVNELLSENARNSFLDLRTKLISSIELEYIPEAILPLYMTLLQEFNGIISTYLRLFNCVGNSLNISPDTFISIKYFVLFRLLNTHHQKVVQSNLAFTQLMTSFITQIESDNLNLSEIIKKDVNLEAKLSHLLWYLSENIEQKAMLLEYENVIAKITPFSSTCEKLLVKLQNVIFDSAQLLKAA